MKPVQHTGCATLKSRFMERAWVMCKHLKIKRLLLSVLAIGLEAREKK
jgi:hypothetical protein